MKSKTLLSILAIVFAIQCAGQTICRNGYCMSYQEYDFYADALVERNGLLQIDSMQRQTIIELKQQLDLFMVADKTHQAAAESSAIYIDSLKDNNADLQNRIDRKTKWNKVYKKIIVGAVVIIVAETSALYLILRP